MAVFTMASSTVMPLGRVVFGPVADTVSINSLLVGTGSVAALRCIPMMVSKTLGKAGRAR